MFDGVKMSDFVPNDRRLREVLIFFFHLKITAHPKFQNIYGDGALSETVYYDRFHCLKDNDIVVDDLPLERRYKILETINWRLSSMNI